MFPPIEESVLRDNPDFAALYKTLTTDILNPDGSTKNDASAKERAAVKQELQGLRHKAIRRQLLTHALCNLIPSPSPPNQQQQQKKPHKDSSSSSQALESEQQDLLIILPALLTPNSKLQPQVLLTLLQHPPLSNLDAHVPYLVSMASKAILAQASALVRIISPTTNPSFLHRAIPSLPAHADALMTAISKNNAAIAAARTEILNATMALHNTYSQCLALLIRALETKHGMAARSVELRAHEIALKARLAEHHAKTAAARARKEVYGRPGVAEALERYAAHLDLEIERTQEVIRRARGQLEGYGVGVAGEEAKEKMAREMGRAWGQLGDELESVKKDLDRLHAGKVMNMTM